MLLLLLMPLLMMILLLLLLLCGQQVDDMLAQAASVSNSLLEQRRVFDNVQDKLLSVGERFPVVNSLLNAIRRKKSKVRGFGGLGVAACSIGVSLTASRTSCCCLLGIAQAVLPQAPSFCRLFVHRTWHNIAVMQPLYLSVGET